MTTHGQDTRELLQASFSPERGTMPLPQASVDPHGRAECQLADEAAWTHHSAASKIKCVGPMHTRH